jgi:Viral BACON domain
MTLAESNSKTLRNSLAACLFAAFVAVPNAALAQGAMTNGEIHSAAISSPGEVDTWTFTASQNDHISLSIGEVLPGGPDPGFVPWIRLQNPMGVQIGSNSGALVGQISVTAPLSGTYTVLVASNDAFNDATGSYRLTLAKVPGAFVVPAGDQGGPMTNGQDHQGSIYVGDLDMWSFSANQNDHLSLSIGEILPGGPDPGFNPWIRLIGPTGALVASNSGALVGQISVTAPLSGTYTVIVATNDAFNDATGTYRLTLARAPGTFVVPPGDEGGPLSNGGNHLGHIHVADLDMWSFSASQNDFISISIGEPPFGQVDPGFNPWIRLIGPTGVLVSSNSGVLVGQISVAAPLSGTYTVLVTTNDAFNDAEGNYRLTLAKIPGTPTVPTEPEDDDGGPMTNGAIHEGNIRTGDLDQWTFQANQNDHLALSIGEPPFGEVDPGYNPWIRLIGPTGVLIASNSGVLVGQITITAPLSGTYTVLVSTNDAFNDAEGSYRLTLARTPATFVVTPGDQGGAMTNGVTHSGDIYRGDLDMWTFHTTQNRALTITITEPPPPELDPGFNPWIRLIGPTGVLVAASSGVLTAQINVNAPLTGTYIVLVGTNDAFNDAVGNYELRVLGATEPTAPTMTLDKSALRFGAVTRGGTFLSQTAAQIVRLTQSGAGTVTWTATPNQPWLQVSPASGTGSANLSVSVVATGGLPPSGSVAASITFALTGASNMVGPITVTLTLIPEGTSATAIGVVDTPTENRTGVTGAVPFTGWALDDVEVARVMICRAAFGAEIAPIDPNCAGAAQIFLGFAVFIDGARPDVQAGFPTLPQSTRAGWGFMVLTNMLPNQGNGSYQFFMYAQDREGHTTLLGTRTMTCANASATLPFGAIDTPTQGGLASGTSFVNFGWALTQAGKFIPTDGSTITVLVDGVGVGTVSYNHFRSDIATLFPGLANSNGAIGFRIIDTTLLTNGLHTISWVVSDNTGAVEGIGSRFFTVSNGAGSMTAAASAERGTSVPLPNAINVVPVDGTPVIGRRGFDLQGPWGQYAVGRSGRAVIRGEEIDRFELALGARPHDALEHQSYSGYLRAGDDLAPLPIGSQLNAETGAFTWAPGVGFVGTYDLVFVRWSGNRAAGRQDVRVIIAPKGRGHVGTQVEIDTPKPQQDVPSTFALTGWAADLDATSGTGIDALHVWAYPLAGGAPVFLGAVTTGGIRPDVAAVHGDQFRTAGFAHVVQALAPGAYDIAVFPWSNVTSGFAPARVVRITVQ